MPRQLLGGFRLLAGFAFGHEPQLLDKGLEPGEVLILGLGPKTYPATKRRVAVPFEALLFERRLGQTETALVVL